MNLWMIGVAAATLGINASWQPLPEGGVEYIIQLDSQSIELLRSGMPLESYIPAGRQCPFVPHYLGNANAASAQIGSSKRAQTAAASYLALRPRRQTDCRTVGHAHGTVPRNHGNEAVAQKHFGIATAGTGQALVASDLCLARVVRLDRGEYLSRLGRMGFAATDEP